MRIAFVGKGGSGKTSVAALFCRTLSAENRTVLAIDADINQYLARALGMTAVDAAGIPALGNGVLRIKEFLRGSNPRISDATHMIKTTPPGKGSRLLRLAEHEPLFSHFQRSVGGIRILAAGPFEKADIGAKCFHAKTGAIELLLNHLKDEPGEYVVVDMTAGADAFASGLFTRFDLTVVVVEPTLQSISVYEQYRAHAEQCAVALLPVGNKIVDVEDSAFLKNEMGQNAPSIFFPRSPALGVQEKGRLPEMGAIEPAFHCGLREIQHALDRCKKDWKRFYEQAIFFHEKNARSWANVALGLDLTSQIDPEFASGFS